MTGTAVLDGLEPLPDDVLVVDAVVHAFNFDQSNIASRYGEALWAMGHGMHVHFNPPGIAAPADLYLSDMPVAALAETMFLESPVDVAVTHTLRLDTWFKDGFCSAAKTEEAVRRWPDRFIGYVGIDPTRPLETCIAELEAQVAALPGAVGLKLYPHQIDPYRVRRADDPEMLILFARARDLGLKTIAIHKALPNGPVPLAPYAVEDMEVACDALPDMAFEIIHAGMAFLDETALALARFPNVRANLETTTALLWRAPGLFEEILAKLLFFGGPDRILFATGCTLLHPRHTVDLFWNLRFSDDVRRKYGLDWLEPDGRLPEPVRRMILGQNYARMIGREPAAMKAAVSDDAFARTRRAEGLAVPYSRWAAAVAGRVVAEGVA
ncbi:MAG: hypothetical protein RLY86_995 [Pseudomonadota bacterium]